MFTGIIEEVGRVKSVRAGSHSATLTIQAHTVLEDVHLGDSIATDGVCLTVTSFSKDSFSADVMHETLRRSSLGLLRAGAPVNLERAMMMGGRFGGHIVSGHIDATGTIVSIERDDNAIWYTISAPRGVLLFLVEKGSVTINGISLTVARVGERDFGVSIIPHTAEQTTLALKQRGDVVNIENDCIGKYVHRFLTAPESIGTNERGIPPAPPVPTGRGVEMGGITEEFLRQNGF